MRTRARGPGTGPSWWGWILRGARPRGRVTYGFYSDFFGFFFLFLGLKITYDYGIVPLQHLSFIKAQVCSSVGSVQRLLKDFRRGFV
jgi:hypothetical protein